MDDGAGRRWVARSGASQRITALQTLAGRERERRRGEEEGTVERMEVGYRGMMN